MATGNRTVDHIEGEEWRPVVESCGWYSVSSMGRVKRHAVTAIGSDGRRLSFGECLMGQNTNADGYKQVRISRLCPMHNRQPMVHRLVFVAFRRELADAEEVNHMNGIKADNRIGNLEAASRQENMAHAKSTGLMAAGDRAGRATLTNAQVLEIVAARRAGAEVKELASHYGVRGSTISNICAGRCWGGITGLTIPPRMGHAYGEHAGMARLRLADVERIFALRESGLSYSKIGRIVGTHAGNVGVIIRGESWVRARANAPTAS